MKKANAPLHLLLRPSTLEEVIGQDAVVKSLRTVLADDHIPHAFLFTGPSGVGKTTLARIIASHVRAAEQDVLEIDAATHSGVEAMREVTRMSLYQGLGGKGVKVFIVDECHALSAATWKALLKSIEEPPPHVYWCLCTTESDKVPKTIVTRCHSYELRSVPKALLDRYLEAVNEEHELGVPDEVIGYVAGRAEGSVRQALVFLSAVRGCASREEAHGLLAGFEETPELIEFVRKLVSGKGDMRWETVTTMLSKLNEPPESIRIVIVNYLGAALMREKDMRKVSRYLNVLNAFSDPYRPAEKYAPLFLSIGRVLLEEE